MKSLKTRRKRFSFRDLTLYLYIRELLNYRYIFRTIKKEKETEQWKSLKLRADWVGRMYTVLNLRKEDTGEEDTVKRARVFELMSPCNNYIKKLDLWEIVFPAIEQITPQSYLVVYSPLFRTVTIIRTIKYLIALGGLIYLGVHAQNIFEYVKNLI